MWGEVGEEVGGIKVEEMCVYRKTGTFSLTGEIIISDGDAMEMESSWGCSGEGVLWCCSWGMGTGGGRDGILREEKCDGEDEEGCEMGKKG